MVRILASLLGDNDGGQAPFCCWQKALHTYCPPAAISSYEGPVVTTRWPAAKDLGAKILERNGEGGADFMVVNSFTHQLEGGNAQAVGDGREADGEQ